MNWKLKTEIVVWPFKILTWIAWTGQISQLLFLEMDQTNNLSIHDITLDEKKEILSLEELSLLHLANDFLSSIPFYLIESIPNSEKSFSTSEKIENKFLEHYVRSIVQWLLWYFFLWLLQGIQGQGQGQGNDHPNREKKEKSNKLRTKSRFEDDGLWDEIDIILLKEALGM